MAHGHKSTEKVVYVGDSRVRKGTMPNTPVDYTAFPGKSEAFIPNFLLKEWMVGVVALVGFLALTIAHPAPLGYPADPTNASFIPMPDWYFLFLYQLLKYPYVSGDFVVLGTVGVPGVAFGALLLAPFLDTGKERRFYKRPIASALLILSILACVYLTKVSWDHYQHQLEINNMTPEHIDRANKAREAYEAGQPRPNPIQQDQAAEVPIVNADDPAMELAATCLQCHGTDMKGQGSIPSLRGIGDRLTEEQIVGIIVNGQGAMPSQADAHTPEEIDQIAAWLASQKAEAAE